MKLMIFLFDVGYGVDHPRYGSTIATKGVGHLVRKGTGGRSSVRYLFNPYLYSIYHEIVLHFS